MVSPFSKIASLLVFYCHFWHWPILGWGEIDPIQIKKESICNHRLNFPLDPSLSDWDMIKPDMDPEPSSSNGSNPDFYLLKLVLNEPVCWCTGTVRKCTKPYQLVPEKTSNFSKINCYIRFNSLPLRHRLEAWTLDSRKNTSAVHNPLIQIFKYVLITLNSHDYTWIFMNGRTFST